jgi:2'-5' RNA ligase
VALSRSEHLTSHWWLRPGWTDTSKFVTWHVLFDDQPALLDVIAGYHRLLEGVAGIDLVPLQWLHLTVQRVGFADALTRQELDAVARRASAQLAELPAFEITFGPPEVHREGVTLTASPARPLAVLRAALRESIAATLSPRRLPEDADNFWPHVAIAYANTAAPAAPLIAALAAASSPPHAVRVAAASMIELRRAERRYVWRRLASVRLGGPR